MAPRAVVYQKIHYSLTGGLHYGSKGMVYQKIHYSLTGGLHYGSKSSGLPEDSLFFNWWTTLWLQGQWSTRSFLFLSWWNLHPKIQRPTKDSYLDIVINRPADAQNCKTSSKILQVES